MEITQETIDAAVLYTLENLDPPPPPTTVAHELIRPSVVRVRHLGWDPEDSEELGVGTGVVIDEAGIILTNLHVIRTAPRIGLVFPDGFETDATVISVQPDNDLAVLQADVVPEGLAPATLASSAQLRPGDPVLAVGNPFGIGPSASAGVVSGLGRTYTSRESGQTLTGLIQFDAAANPGNSGGPLVNMQGEVVGIVTAILNPTDQPFFVGIGFAVTIETAAGAAGMSPF
jgi:S1-C subfamily serine protease